MWFEALLLAASVVAGAIAALAGFGIGSLVTPILALQVDTRLAVAAVAVPHAIGTALRLWFVAGAIDRRVFWQFGLTSAAGGLTGALLYGRASNRWLAVVFGCLLLFAAASQASGLAQRMRFRGHIAWIAGAASGFLGGLVGNQGGIRSAALVGFDLPKERFVATATAIGIVVDAARMPVYLAMQYDALSAIWPWIVLAAIGVTAGTVLGTRVLAWIPEVLFRRLLAALLAILGGAMLLRGVLNA